MQIETNLGAQIQQLWFDYILILLHLNYPAFSEQIYAEETGWETKGLFSIKMIKK